MSTDTARTCPSLSMFRTSELSDPRACMRAARPLLSSPSYPRTLVPSCTSFTSSRAAFKETAEGRRAVNKSRSQSGYSPGFTHQSSARCGRTLTAARISHAACPRHVTAAMMSTRSQVVPHRDLGYAALWDEACLRSPRKKKRRIARTQTPVRLRSFVRSAVTLQRAHSGDGQAPALVCACLRSHAVSDTCAA